MPFEDTDDADAIRKALEESRLSFLTVKRREGTAGVIEKTAAKTAPGSKVVLTAKDGLFFICRIIPVFFESHPQGEEDGYGRMEAVHDIFERWCQAGLNTGNTRDAYSSKDFSDFLDESGYRQAEWIVLG